MKKIITLLLSLVLIGGCSSNTPVETTFDRVDTIVEIDYETLVEKLENNVDFLLYIGRPDCSDCATFYPYLEEYVNNNQKGIYYLNIQSMRDEARKEDATQEEIDFYENLQERLNFEWTPMLQHYQNGKVIDSYTFLDMDYYQIEDENERKEAFDQYVSAFETWMTTNFC